MLSFETVKIPFDFLEMNVPQFSISAFRNACTHGDPLFLGVYLSNDFIACPANKLAQNNNKNMELKNRICKIMNFVLMFYMLKLLYKC